MMTAFVVTYHLARMVKLPARPSSQSEILTSSTCHTSYTPCVDTLNVDVTLPAMIDILIGVCKLLLNAKAPLGWTAQLLYINTNIIVIYLTYNRGLYSLASSSVTGSGSSPRSLVYTCGI